jgi:Icc-related predicted phosphoesterase/predicted nucleotidyltransferase
MKIIYLTDLHGAFSKVSALLLETVADVYIISGDLIDIPFYNIDTAIRYYDLQTHFTGLRKKTGHQNMILEDFVEKRINSPEATEEDRIKGKDYLHYTVRARRVMHQKYKVLENILSMKSNARIFVLPGNYDMDLKFTSLAERDLHMRSYCVEKMRIAGYGGADIWTAGLPEKYIVKYKGAVHTGSIENEMFTYFKAVKPDVIVAHQPAHGIHDRIPSRGPTGSTALRVFCDNNKVKLCLTGHIHTQWGFEFSEGTVYLNPSNFGEVTTLKDEVSEGGFFYEIETDGCMLKTIKLKKLVDERIYDITNHSFRNGAWSGEIIDTERYNARKRDDNFDFKTPKISHIPEIELFNEIKHFFRMYQTRETEARLKLLEKTAIDLLPEFGTLAMDVLGSVNLGMSQKSSDIDLVLYLRCGTECGDSHENCARFRQVIDRLKEILGAEYKFEILDCINLDIVEQSIIEKNYECEVTQRFVTYRSICRPINYMIIAPLEDMLNEDIEFRKELEGSVRSYFKIFVTTSRHIRSFDKYTARLAAIGIRIPVFMRKKIKEYLGALENPPQDL